MFCGLDIVKIRQTFANSTGNPKTFYDVEFRRFFGSVIVK